MGFWKTFPIRLLGAKNFTSFKLDINLLKALYNVVACNEPFQFSASMDSFKSSNELLMAPSVLGGGHSMHPSMLCRLPSCLENPEVR